MTRHDDDFTAARRVAARLQKLQEKRLEIIAGAPETVRRLLLAAGTIQEGEMLAGDTAEQMGEQ